MAINDSTAPVTATLTCRLIDLSGALLDKVVFPIVASPFSVSTLVKLPKAIVSPADSSKCCLHMVMESNDKKIAENIFFYLPDKYIDWPQSQLKTQLSRLTDTRFALTLKSSAVAKDVHISAAASAHFSDNFIDLIPPTEPVITIDFEQAQLSEPILHLRSVNCYRGLPEK